MHDDDADDAYGAYDYDGSGNDGDGDAGGSGYYGDG